MNFFLSKRENFVSNSKKTQKLLNGLKTDILSFENFTLLGSNLSSENKFAN